MGKRAQFDWAEIKRRWLGGEKIEDLATEYGFNMKYWYRRYHQTWKAEKEHIEEIAEEIVYRKAVNDEIDKRETIRNNYGSFANRLFMFTVKNMENVEKLVEQADTLDKKFKAQKAIKIASESLAVLKEIQFDIQYIYTKTDQLGDMIAGVEPVEEPEIVSD